MNYEPTDFTKPLPETESMSSVALGCGLVLLLIVGLTVAVIFIGGF